jgi:hypothetical protein
MRPQEARPVHTYKHGQNVLYTGAELTDFTQDAPFR